MGGVRGPALIRGMSRATWTGVGLLVGVLAWWAIALWVGPSRLPTPPQQFAALVEVVRYSPVLAAQPGGTGRLLGDLAYTTTWCVLGVMVGGGLGIATGLVMASSPAIRNLFTLPIEVFRTVPPLAAVPFVLMWLGPSALTQFAVLVFYSFLRLVINAVEAVRNVPPVFRQFSRTLGASPGQTFRTVVLPAILPELVGGMRVAFAAAWGLQIVVELLGSPAGIGKLFAYLVPLLRPDLIIALIIWVTVVAVALDQWVLVPFVRWSTRWVPRTA
jgi:ABC-type nitrate/sulfonate/bicarbonate transport system permease component